MLGWNITSRDKEKTEVLNDSSTSAFHQKPSSPQDIQPPELEDRNREQNEAPTLQEEVVSELLCSLGVLKSKLMPSLTIRLQRKLLEQLSRLHSPSFISSPG